MKKLQSLLKKLGATPETIKLFADVEVDFDVAAVLSEIDASMRTALENDDTFVDPIAERVRGEFLASKERKLVKVSNGLITKEEVEAMPKKERYDKLVELLAERLGKASGEGKTGDDKDKEIQRLNDELAAKQAELKKVREEELPQAQAQVEAARSEMMLERHLEELLIGDQKRTLVLDPARTLRLLRDDLSREYDLGWDRAASAPVIKQKGKDLQAINPDTRKPWTTAELVAHYGDKAKLFAVNNGGGEKDQGRGKGGEAGGGTKERKYQLPGMKAAEAAIKEREAEKA